MINRSIPFIHPLDASLLKSTGSNILVYRAKESVGLLNVEKGKFYYLDEDGTHKLFSIGNNSAINPPVVFFTCGVPVVVNDETKSGFGTGLGDTIIDSDDVQVHSVYHVEMYGRIEIEEESNDEIVMTIKLGSTTLYTETFGLLGEDTGLFISFNISVAAVGSSGTVYLIAPDPVGPFLTHTFPKDLQTSATPRTIDFTSDKTIDVVFESTGDEATVTVLNSIITKIN
jgi:hypothetical protein